MKTAWTLLAAAALAGPLAAETPSAIAIRNAKVVTVSGPVMQRATVVMRNGLIEAVGENASIPADAWVIDGEAYTVYPGLVDGLSTVGLPGAVPAVTAGRGAPAALPTPAAAPAPPSRGPEDRPQTTSWLRAADQFQANDRRIESARNAGYTAAAVFPARGIFAGQGAVIALAGERPGNMVLAPAIGQYTAMPTAGFGGGFPSALFGVIAYMRQIFLDAAQYQQAKAMYAANSRGMNRPAYDRALEGVLESPRILMPARRWVEIDRHIALAKEWKQNLILYGGMEAYRPEAVELLRKNGVPMLVSLKWPEKNREADPEDKELLRDLTNRDMAPSAPAALAKAGVKFAFYTDGIEGRANVHRAVKKALDAGLPFDQAIRALTLSPAEIFQVADRIGSIERGKIANLLVTKGDLFQDRTEIKFIFVDGVKYEPGAEPETPGAGGPGRPPGPPSGEKEGGN